MTKDCIIFYSDHAGGFGGHELSSIHAVKGILDNSQKDVVYILSKYNKKLQDEILKINSERILIIKLSFKTRSSLMYLNFLFKFWDREIKTILEQLPGNSYFVAVQGTIETSFTGFRQAKKMGFKTISYIPFCHTFSDGGFRFGWIKDLFAKQLYKVPDKFITISKFVKDELVRRERIDENKISVVYAAGEFGRGDSLDEPLKFSKGKTRVALVGRVVFPHKNQLFLVNFVRKYKAALTDYEFYIIGDGEDLEALRNEIQAAKAGDILKILPWEDERDKLFSQVDILVIPSFFEGIPLVLYEAMYYKKPIIASNIPGHAEMLHSDVLFEINDYEKFYSILTNIKKLYPEIILEKNRQRMLTNHTIEKFGQNFYANLVN